MELAEARRMAYGTMRDHGLIADGWTFKFDRAVKRLGLCSYRDKVISLSAPLVRVNSEEEILETVLHEVGHALAGPLAKHGASWRAAVRRIGGHPERVSVTAVTPALRYKATCSGCGNENYRARYSASMHGLACGKCCKRYAGGRFDSRFILVWVDTRTGVAVS